MYQWISAFILIVWSKSRAFSFKRKHMPVQTIWIMLQFHFFLTTNLTLNDNLHEDLNLLCVIQLNKYNHLLPSSSLNDQGTYVWSDVAIVMRYVCLAWIISNHGLYHYYFAKNVILSFHLLLLLSWFTLVSTWKGTLRFWAMIS